jgi:signal transduction histidine kinase
MRTSALNINRLLENLLEWAKVQRGITKCEPVTTLLNPIIMRLAELMKTYASGKDISMKIDIAQHIMIHADMHMFDTVMRNLISNAIKFSRTGSEIIISAVANQEGIVTISVKDRGIGMNADQLGSLFEINLQANRKGTAGEPSTGLGLILSKEFVEMNGGKIWAESIEHEGSTFHFTLHANA